MREEDSNASTIRHDPVVQEAVEKHTATHTIKENTGKIVIGGVLAVIMIFASFALIITANEKDYTTGYSLYALQLSLGYLILAIAAWGVAYHLFILLGLTFHMVPGWGTYVIGVLKTQKGLLSLLVASTLVSYAIGGTTVVSQEGAAKKADPVSEFHGMLSQYFIAIAYTSALFLLKNVIVHTLNYNVHISHYAERIAENTERINLMTELNSLVSYAFNDNISKVCMMIIDKIAADKRSIRYPELLGYLGVDKTNRVFSHMGRSPDEGISHGDLVHFYCSTLFTLRQLSDGLTQMNASVANLNFVITLICIPVAFNVFFSTLNVMPTSTSKMTIVMTGLVSGGYILADTIKSFICSVIFVFFIRPFEIRDFVIIDGQLYRVKEINIMTSVLLRNRLAVTVPNSALFGKNITNYRTSKNVVEPYVFKFGIKEYKEKREKLLENLFEHMKTKPETFDKRPVFVNPKMVSNKELEVELRISYLLTKMTMKEHQREKEGFVGDLHGIFEQTGLIPFKAD